jgi:holo-[acyl-carrier-protein] synthase
VISGIGCDIVHVNRIRKQNETFYKRVLTEKEQELYLSFTEARKLEFLAGRFAAKEAIYKACNDTKVISNIEVLNDESGRPYCNVDGYKIHISISHDGDYAMAYAICEKV